METELSHLEGQLEQLIGLFESSRSEMRTLRARIAALEADNRQLAEKVCLASEKLESLIARLPEA